MIHEFKGGFNFLKFHVAVTLRNTVDGGMETLPRHYVDDPLHSIASKTIEDLGLSQTVLILVKMGSMIESTFDDIISLVVFKN